MGTGGTKTGPGEIFPIFGNWEFSPLVLLQPSVGSTRSKRATQVTLQFLYKVFQLCLSLRIKSSFPQSTKPNAGYGIWHRSLRLYKRNSRTLYLLPFIYSCKQKLGKLLCAFEGTETGHCIMALKRSTGAKTDCYPSVAVINISNPDFPRKSRVSKADTLISLCGFSQVEMKTKRPITGKNTN